MNPIGRRKLLQAGLVLGASQVASPFVLRARAADSVKIGVDNPLTGTYAAPGKNELVGFQLGVEQINAKGGILGGKSSWWSRIPPAATPARRCRRRAS